MGRPSGGRRGHRRHAGRQRSARRSTASRDYGAEVILHGAHVGETFAEMERLRDERGLTFVHPFDDPEVIAGHGSIGLEILEDLPDVDVVVVGVGGGGLISGVAAAIKESRPATRVFGVEPNGIECRAACHRGRRGRSDRAQERRRRPRCSVRGRVDAGADAGAISTASSCWTTRRSWRACGSPPSG